MGEEVPHQLWTFQQWVTDIETLCRQFQASECAFLPAIRQYAHQWYPTDEPLLRADILSMAFLFVAKNRDAFEQAELLAPGPFTVGDKRLIWGLWRCFREFTPRTGPPARLPTVPEILALLPPPES